MKILNVLKAFIYDRIEAVEVLEDGHINSSVLVKGRELYVLQCMNNRLYSNYLDELEHNYLKYRAACEKLYKNPGEWYCPDWIKDREGRFFHKDSDGNIWRLYRYIPSDDQHGACENTYSIGKGLGKLHKVLRECTDIKTIGSTAHLHDLTYHYDKYRMQDSSVMERIEEIDRFILNNIESMLSITVPEGGVIHGDAKVGNMLFKGGEVIGFIDLDTLMHGSLYDDIADCMRSCCIDDRGDVDSDRATKLYCGYEDGSESRLSEDEISLIGRNLSRNRFMLGLRYYTDYLSGEGYFSGSPAQKLEKVRALYTIIK
ncbi:MAG: phosphotransferase [Lachnospiraceae bacterium]|nr:phosphotransferase [Lachnospiraceae bacterium]